MQNSNLDGNVYQPLPINLIHNDWTRTKTFSNETFELPLPDEIMMKIFEYFSGNQILINIAPVCKQFYRLSQEPKLLKKIVITRHMDRSSNSKMQGYMHGIKSKKGLTTLIIETGKNDIFYVKTALEYCPKLINLKISPGNQNHSETKTPFDDTLRYINQKDFPLSYANNWTPRWLQSLDLEFISISERGFRQICQLTCLKHLRLKRIDNYLKSHNVESLAKNCKNLQSLDIEVDIEAISNKSFAYFLKERKNSLRKLCLERRPDQKGILLTGNGICFTRDAFNNLHLVENLDELSINMGEISVPLEILSQLHQLRIFRLYYVAIGRELAFDFHNIQQWPFPEEPSMVQVFSNFNFRQLKKLIIDQDFNQMSGQFLKTMAANCPNLESLFINSYDRKNIEDQDIQFIFENCRNLQKVSLEGLEGLTYKCMERITDCLPKLRYLNLTSILGCHTIEDEINTCRVLDKIIEHNKDLEIIHPDIRFINARQKKHGIVKLKRIPITTEQLRSTRKRPLPEEDDKSTSNKKEKQKLKCAMEHRRN